MSSEFNEETVVISEEEKKSREDEEEEEEEDKEEEEEDDDDDDEGFSVLSDLPVEKSERRPTCRRCCRPLKVCLCPFLPLHPLDVSTCLYIVQHPAEESRVLRTVPLLAACLPVAKCRVLVGRRFSEDRYPELAAVCRDTHTMVLYPGADAHNLEELQPHAGDTHTNTHTLILIDGTWSQARDMFLKNTLLQLPRQVQLRSAPSSQYVIRTQPNNMCVSTLECAAVALSVLENDRSIQEVLLRPLRALCSFQLQHGAQVHHSKEHLIRSGEYKKILPRNKRKIRRMQKLISNQSI